MGIDILFSEAVFFHSRVFTSFFTTLESDRYMEHCLRKTSTDFLFAALCNPKQKLVNISQRLHSVFQFDSSAIFFLVKTQMQKNKNAPSEMISPHYVHDSTVEGGSTVQ